MRARGFKFFLDPLQFVALRAIETSRVGGVAVQFDDVTGRDAGRLVKVIDILRHQRRDLAGAIETAQRQMPPPRLRLGETLLHDEAPAPGLIAHLGACHKRIERDRLVLGPQAAGRAEIRDAAFGRYARPGEWDDCLRALDQVTQTRNRCRKIRSNHYYRVAMSGRLPIVREVHPMRFLHTMLRVRNLDAAMEFYSKLLGLQEIRRRVDEKNRYTLVFLAAPDDAAAATAALKAGRRDAPVVELTYNYDTEDYGEARYFGHLAFEVDDIYATCDRLMKAGVTINRPPRDGVMAFVRSPDKHSIELLQKGAAKPPQEPWSSMKNTGKW